MWVQLRLPMQNIIPIKGGELKTNDVGHVSYNETVHIKVSVVRLFTSYDGSNRK